METCVRCHHPIVDLMIDDGSGPRHYVYCPTEHEAWFEKFKVYQDEFSGMVHALSDGDRLA